MRRSRSRKGAFSVGCSTASRGWLTRTGNTEPPFPIRIFVFAIEIYVYYTQKDRFVETFGMTPVHATGAVKLSTLVLYTVFYIHIFCFGDVTGVSSVLFG